MTTIAIARAESTPQLSERIGGRLPCCNGCKHNWYSARYGLKGDYPGRPEILSQPHSRCTELGEYVPMVMGEHDKWLASRVPVGCPEYRQPSLPGMA